MATQEQLEQALEKFSMPFSMASSLKPTSYTPTMGIRSNTGKGVYGQMKRNLKQVTMPGQQPTITSPNNISDTMGMHQNGMSWSDIFSNRVKAGALSREQILGLVGGAGGGLLLSHLFSGRKKRGLIGTIIWGGLGALAGYLGANYLASRDGAGEDQINPEGSMDPNADNPDRDPKSESSRVSPEQQTERDRANLVKAIEQDNPEEIIKGLNQATSAMSGGKPGSMSVVPPGIYEALDAIAHSEQFKTPEIAQAYQSTSDQLTKNEAIYDAQINALVSMKAVELNENRDENGELTSVDIVVNDPEMVELGADGKPIGVAPEYVDQFVQTIQHNMEQEIAAYHSIATHPSGKVNSQFGELALNQLMSVPDRYQALLEAGQLNQDAVNDLSIKAMEAQYELSKVRAAGGFYTDEHEFDAIMGDAIGAGAWIGGAGTIAGEAANVALQLGGVDSPTVSTSVGMSMGFAAKQLTRYSSTQLLHMLGLTRQRPDEAARFIRQLRDLRGSIGGIKQGLNTLRTPLGLAVGAKNAAGSTLHGLGVFALIQMGIDAGGDALSSFNLAQQKTSIQAAKLRQAGKIQEAEKLENMAFNYGNFAKAYGEMTNRRNALRMQQINEDVQTPAGFAGYAASELLKGTPWNPYQTSLAGYHTSKDVTDQLYRSALQLQQNFGEQAGEAKDFLREQWRALNNQKQHDMAMFLTNKSREQIYGASGTPWDQMAQFGHFLTPIFTGEFGGRWSAGDTRDQWTKNYLATNPTPSGMQSYQNVMYPELPDEERTRMLEGWQAGQIQPSNPAILRTGLAAGQAALGPQIDMAMEQAKRKKDQQRTSLNSIGRDVSYMKAMHPGF